MIAAWLAENIAVVIVATITAAGAVGSAIYTRRSARDVAQLSAEEGAYTRATEIDKGVVARLEAERDYLSDALETERTGRREDALEHAREKAELRAEAARLEARLRELLDEVVALRSRHGD